MMPTVQKISANLSENSKTANVSEKYKTNCRNFKFSKEKANLKEKSEAYVVSLIKYFKENKKKTLTCLAVAAYLRSCSSLCL